MPDDLGIPAHVSGTLLGHALDDFLLDCRARQLAPATIDFYRTKLVPFNAFCAEHGTYTVEAVTSSLLKRFMLAMTDRGCQPQTVCVNMRSVRAFLNYCQRDGILENNPFDRIKLPKVDHVIKDALTVEQIKTLIKACQGALRDHALFLFMLDTGVRASELVAISVGDLNMEKQSVLLRHTKSRRQRICYLSPRTAKVVRKFLAKRKGVRPKEPLFPGKSGLLRPDGLVQFFDRLSRKTGIHVTAHMLRRTCVIHVGHDASQPSGSTRVVLPAPDLTAWLDVAGSMA